VERFHPFAEIVRAAQAAIAVAFEFNGDGQRCIFRVVEKFLGSALGQRRKAAQLIDQPCGGSLQLGIWHAFRSHAPVVRLRSGNSA
jgi:hypothetical protein